MFTMLITLPYIRVIRRIHNNSQQIIETEEYLTLYEDKVVSANDHFKMEDILDMSYRPFNDRNGFLYFHTIRGLYSFHLKTDPNAFMTIYKKIRLTI
ncbi:hypothetical protein J7E71_05110 [Mesobacillus foraminis]|uniref:hypothetical protein n=1 Tax=Mesobacillus foraminis TaxID=279826 RepID=UPI001BEBA624|nr:hypothetical protein [Mesobacillus foraminis]MBT2755337.1 hypothetical protein [Mesobacillus foraminis]